ncbi:hypothetical protein PRUB_b0678 [Pseudoalteromonas rubra]|uniref:Uncharacterized protein n=1 Tax=Pseudoalteromonas rubra TaxID=43658 RepID=A0A8T0C0E6_9GAMM|nr:hypothetical protein [Pseudoalteromonas rubra]KAF7781455.1 hypothetical protein PRUB_b0678 [Pseudoalteromonas rubra]
MEIYFESEIAFSYFELYFRVFTLLVLFFSYNKVKAIFDEYVFIYFNVHFSIFWSLAIFFSIGYLISMLNKKSDFELVSESQHEVVRGVVSNYKVENSASRKESFKVNDVNFEYNNVVTPPYFFANRRYDEGVIKNGRYVAVFYVSDGRKNYITRLEFDSFQE